MFDLGSKGGKDANVDQLKVIASGSAKPKGDNKISLTIKGEKEVSAEVEVSTLHLRRTHLEFKESIHAVWLDVSRSGPEDP